MAIRPRINVSMESWQFFIKVFPDIEKTIEKLYATFNDKTISDYSKSYLLFLTFPQSELLQALLFNPNIASKLHSGFPEEVKKFVSALKLKRLKDDEESWEKYIRSTHGDYPEYPTTNQENANSLVTFILSKEKLTQSIPGQNKHKIGSYFVFKKLLHWLDFYSIKYEAETKDDIDDTLWYDYSITIL